MGKRDEAAAEKRSALGGKEEQCEDQYETSLGNKSMQADLEKPKGGAESDQNGGIGLREKCER